MWYSPRISYANNVTSRLEHLNFKNYKAFKPNDMTITKKKRLTMSMESQYKVIDPFDEKEKSFDIIVLDELETFKKVWINDITHHKHLPENWRVFLQLMRNAKKIIIMDAFPHKAMIEWVSLLRPEGLITLGNEFIPPPQRVIKYDNKDVWRQSLIDELNKGYNIPLFYPYKTDDFKKGKGIYCFGMDTFKDIILQETNLEKDDIMCYHAMSDDNDKQTTCDVDIVWSTKRLIISNVSITVGVNYERLHFHKKFAFLDPNTVEPRDFFQNIGRVRQYHIYQ